MAPQPPYSRLQSMRLFSVPYIKKLSQGTIFWDTVEYLNNHNRLGTIFHQCYKEWKNLLKRYAASQDTLKNAM